MSDTNDPWAGVGSQFAALGERLRRHYKGPTGPNVDAAEAKKKVDRALDDLAAVLDSTVEAVGDAVRDPEVKDQARKAATAFGDALAQTLDSVSDDVRARWSARRGGDS